MESTKAGEYVKFLDRITSRYELPTEINDATVNDFVSKMGSSQAIWGLSGRDVSGVDFSKISEETFSKLAFNDYTKFPRDFKIDYKRILEESKNPGLGVSELHAKGVNGNGVNAAVIDKPILETHTELTGKIKSYTLINPESEYNDEAHFHGITCAAFLCGNVCGVAPGSNLFYYAYPDRFEDDGMYWNYHFKALDMIMERNRSVSPDEKIKIVSISAGFPKDRADLFNKMNEYVSAFEDNGCYIVFSNLFGETFSCSSKKTNFDNDNPDTYKLDFWQNDWTKTKTLIPAGGRTSPCNSGNDKYMYNGSQACYSWAIPYLCGVFALALQTNKDLSYSAFCKKARDTAHTNKDGLFIINPAKIAGT